VKLRNILAQELHSRLPVAHLFARLWIAPLGNDYEYPAGNRFRTYVGCEEYFKTGGHKRRCDCHLRNRNCHQSNTQKTSRVKRAAYAAHLPSPRLG